ncbi:MAG: hypothetical protein MJB57_05420, partial [Gemmatimonadetes bacterium]|nr:hypothetical protein [Gemmatimonadota bacterium]
MIKTFSRQVARALIATALAPSVGAVACATKSVTTTPVYRPAFDYAPSIDREPASAGVVFALVRPQYAAGELTGTYTASGTPRPEVEPFASFADNLAFDFQELLVARGFTVTGPYRSYAEMTYPERQTADFALVATL